MTPTSGSGHGMQAFYGGYTGLRHSLVSRPRRSLTNSQPRHSPLPQGPWFASIMTLPAGFILNNVSLINAVTATSTPTHQWAGIASSQRLPSPGCYRRHDNGGGRRGCGATFAFALPTPSQRQAYWIFFCIAGTTGPTFAAATTLGSHGRGQRTSVQLGAVRHWSDDRSGRWFYLYHTHRRRLLRHLSTCRRSEWLSRSTELGRCGDHSKLSRLTSRCFRRQVLRGRQDSMGNGSTTFGRDDPREYYCVRERDGIYWFRTPFAILQPKPV